MIEDIFEIVARNKEGFLSGLSVTIKMCLCVWIIGLGAGTIVGYFASKRKILARITGGISFLLSGVPILVFLFWLHYPAQSFLNISVDPFVTAVAMLSVLNIIAIAQIVQNGIQNIPNQYLEVAKISGLSSRTIFVKIEAPLVIRHILPSLLTTQVNMLHMTLFASLISVEEIFRVSQRIISMEYKPIEVYTALGIFFLIVSLPINGVALVFKRRFARNLDEK